MRLISSLSLTITTGFHENGHENGTDVIRVKAIETEVVAYLADSYRSLVTLLGSELETRLL